MATLEETEASESASLFQTLFFPGCCQIRFAAHCALSHLFLSACVPTTTSPMSSFEETLSAPHPMSVLTWPR